MQDVSTPCQHYNECGCEVSSCCIECPLPVCKEELKQGMQEVRARMRGIQIALFREEGHTVKWIAQIMGITPRGVYKSVALLKRSELESLTDSSRHAKMSIAAHSVSENGERRAR